VVVDWREQQKLLKLRFPLNLNQMKVTSEIPYGHLEHFANGEEEPGQSWLDLSGIARDSLAMYGLSLLNDGKYAWDVDIRDIGLTVLRSPIYAHHIPAVPQADGHYSFIDQGIQHFNYSLLPHPGLWEQAGTVHAAAELNTPPVAIVATAHGGRLPQRDAFIEVVPDAVVVSAVKQAEDDDALIVRAYETTRAATQALIRLPHWGRVIEAQFGPSEIKTFRVPRDPAQPVAEVNLLEWPA
jgi:alpha-mannosidase